MKRRKENNESLALPPPVPPRFTPQFQSVINLLQCDVMIYIMELILSRTVATRSRSWSEAQMERVSLALPPPVSPSPIYPPILLCYQPTLVLYK